MLLIKNPASQHFRDDTAIWAITSSIRKIEQGFSMANGVPIETVSRMLGPTKITTTQSYAKVLENKVSADIPALEEKLKNMK
ncbi:hypothetical protein V9K67_00710 [Paraflavisolibacter sp. H34]